jgi:hypothetical protein
MVKKGDTYIGLKPASYVMIGNQIRATIHTVDERVEVIVFSDRNPRGSIRFRGLQMGELGLSGLKNISVPFGKLPVAKRDPAWFRKWNSKIIPESSARNTDVERFIYSEMFTPRIRREIFSGHIIWNYAFDDSGKTVDFTNSENIVAETAAFYRDLLDWGETSAVTVIASSFGMTPIETVKGRLKIARQRGLIISPGAGARSPRTPKVLPGKAT